MAIVIRWDGTLACLDDIASKTQEHAQDIGCLSVSNGQLSFKREGEVFNINIGDSIVIL